MYDFNIYSPEEQLHDPLFTEKQVQVFIKRDDMIHPFISGNKWRKLKYLLQQAGQQQKKHLVTFGGAWSNHLLATACAAAKFGFTSTGFVRGEDVKNPLLGLCRMFGMNLLFTDRESYRDKRMLYEKAFASSPDTFFIDEGGASAEAALGCSELVGELDRKYDHLFCACGTGTTAAGIINGLTRTGAPTLLHAVPVLKNGEFIRDEINRYLDLPATFRLHTGYHFGGYANAPSELMDFMRTFSAATGILADPVYTGKVLFAVYDLISKNSFGPGSSILVIHTGGLMGLLGKM